MRAKTYRRYADLILAAHFVWTLFLLAGAIAMFFYPPYAWIQIGAMTFTLLLALPFKATCPLTLLEEKFRQKSDPEYRNDGSYIATYFNKIFKTHIPVIRVNTTIAGLYILTYALAISLLILRGYGFLSL
jgi:hypothetical protein